MPSAPSASGAALAASDGTLRPSLMRKSSSTHSPSASEAPPLRHHAVKKKGAGVILPRNASSARNLPKVQYADDGPRKHHSRQRSHEGDTAIRLPGSLDESVPVSRPAMKRNMTAYQLPRNSSHAKLKKNLSHGQLTRLGSGKNLAGLGRERAAPLSPGLKGRSKRPKSAEMSDEERRRKGAAKKVGFAVGSAGDASEEGETLEMEGSGLQEDEWTEDSASASPYSTRANTANNSRTSVVVEKLNEKLAKDSAARMQEHQAREERMQAQKVSQSTQEDDEDEESDSDDAPSPLTMGQGSKVLEPMGSRSEPDETVPNRTKEAPPTTAPEQPTQQAVSQKQQQQPPPQRSPLHYAKDYTNPSTHRLLDKNQQLPAPALLSNVSALDDTHSARGSPAPSLRGSRPNLADNNSPEQQEDELVSRFVPSGSHPSTGSGPTTGLNTPKETSFHTPEEDRDNTLSDRQQHEEKHHHHHHNAHFQIGPVSPGGSTSSGHTTPAIGRSRTELRMLQEKAIADIESQADKQPLLPKHIFDRRNESLKYYLNANNERSVALVGIGTDVFQGRFKALNTELKVVQKFRDPMGEAVARLKMRQKQKQGMPSLAMSKSAVSLPVVRRAMGELSKSASPPKAVSLKGSAHGSLVMRPRREVSFAQGEGKGEGEGGSASTSVSVSSSYLAPDVIAKRLWEAV